MADINSAVFSGRLVRDAEKKTLPTGTDLVTFDLANNTGYGDYQKVLFMTINLWGKSGLNILQYLNKGKLVGVQGQLELQKWTSKQDGSEHQKLVLNCNNVILFPSASGQSQQPTQTFTHEAEPLAEEDITF